jgi:hypothetical protein
MTHVRPRAYALALATLAFVVASCGANTSSGARSLSPVSSTSSIPQQAAVAVALNHVGGDHVHGGAAFLRAQLVPFSEVSTEPGQTANALSSDKLVWAVTFAVAFDPICNPLSGACVSAGPGTSLVVVDASTGEWIWTSSFSVPIFQGPGT